MPQQRGRKAVPTVALNAPTTARAGAPTSPRTPWSMAAGDTDTRQVFLKIRCDSVPLILFPSSGRMQNAVEQLQGG